MNPLGINTVGDELEAAADYCRTAGLGLEVTDFAFPENLEANSSSLIDRHLAAIAGVMFVTSHGPFFDLIATSRDRAIVEISRRRHDTALAASARLGASHYVAHTSYNPLIRDPAYRRNWPRRMLDFWLPLADQAATLNIIICLENQWEPEPDIQAELLAAADHPHLRATFDNGHVLVFSTIPSHEWVASLGPWLAHCHLHDNSGELDEHKPIGDGIERWDELIAAIRTHAPAAILVAESDSLDNNKRSIDRLKSL